MSQESDNRPADRQEGTPDEFEDPGSSESPEASTPDLLVGRVAGTICSAADLKTYYQALALRRRLDRNVIFDGVWRVLLGGIIAGASAIGLYVTVFSATITAATSAVTAATSARDSAQMAEQYATSERDRALNEQHSADAERYAAVAKRDEALQELEKAKQVQARAVADRDKALEDLKEAEDTVRREVRFLGSVWRTGAEFDGPQRGPTHGQELIAELVGKVGDRCGASNGHIPGEPRRLRVTLSAQGHLQYEAMLRHPVRGLSTCTGIGVWSSSEAELTLQFCNALAKGSSGACQGPPLLILNGTVPAGDDLPPVLVLAEPHASRPTPFRQASWGLW